MIVGVVKARREATIRFPVRAAGGPASFIDAVLDTGFNGSLTLPPKMIAALGLPWRTRALVILANGSEDLCDIYAAVVRWDGRPRSILVEEADTDPLVGMALLSGYEVRMQVIEGGIVTIGALP
jgi:clan AA aspartic protease